MEGRGQRVALVESMVPGPMPGMLGWRRSRIEFLVRFPTRGTPTLIMRRYADAVAMERELAELAGRDVELVDYRSVVDWSDDYTRRKTVLESAQVILAA